MLPYAPSDQEQVAAWCAGHGMPFVPENLPRLGLIVPGLAAGWMLECEKNLYMFDLLVSNPDRPGREREEAVDAVLGALFGIADREGRRVFAFTGNPAVARRVRKHGFGRFQQFWSMAREPQSRTAAAPALGAGRFGRHSKQGG